MPSLPHPYRMQVSLMRSMFLLILVVSPLVNGCISLAPPYDQKITETLQTTSIEIMQVMAAVSDGADSTTYKKSEEKYNAVIGKIDALKLMIDARPLPKGKIIDKINAEMKKRGFSWATDTSPSSDALEHIGENLRMVKASHKANSLNATEAKLFRTNIVLFLDQAITYESILKR